MTAGLGQVALGQPTQPTGVGPSALPSTFGERLSAGFSAQFTEDAYGNYQRALIERNNAKLQDYYAITGEKLLNPDDLQPTAEEIRENLGASIPAIMGKRRDKARAAMAAVRGKIGDLGNLPPGFLDLDYTPTEIGRDSQLARNRADALEGTGGGFGDFLGRAAGGMAASPLDILGLGFLGATAVPRVAAQREIAAWALNAVKEGGFQAGTQVALSIPGMAAEHGTRKQTGTEPTMQETLTNVAGIAAIGGTLGFSVRALHGWLTKIKLHEVKTGETVLSPAADDASKVIEGDALYGDKNPMGYPAANHEVMTDGAMTDVLQARAPTGPYDVPVMNERGVPIGPRSIFEEPLPDLKPGVVEPEMFPRREGPVTLEESAPSPELKAEVAQVSKMIDQPLPQAPTVPEAKGPGRPQEGMLTPEQETLIQTAKARAEQMEGGESFLRSMETLDEHEGALTRLARHCGLKVK